MKNEEKYWVYTNHHYLTQYVIMVDIGNRFRNVKEYNGTNLHGFFRVFEKILDKKWFRYGWKKKNIMNLSQNPST